MCGDIGEDRVRLLQVPEQGIAENLLAVSRLIARLRSWLGPGGRQVDQRPRLGHGQGPEQHLVEQGEDGGVRPDPQGQREDGDRRDERGL